MKALWRFPLMCLVTIGCTMLRKLGMRSDKVLHLWARVLMHIHNITIIGEPTEFDAQLLISNHVGYIDALPYFYFYPQVKFIADVRVERFFLIGRLFRACGALLPLDRENKVDRARVREEAVKIWEKGGQVAVAPEGTVSYVGLTFHPGMFDEAVKAGVKIQGIKIEYPKDFIEKMKGKSMEDQVWLVSGQDIEIHLTFFPVIRAMGDPKKLCLRWQKKLVNI